jgi:cytochrome oxidase Cu insertion factor (SCO1/SenC/PrrC family)
VLVYAVAGALVALPETAWRDARLGTLLLRGIGLFFIGMAVLQAWPGRGFWQGGKDGTLAGMIGSMSSTTQPHMLSQIVSGAGSFTSAHGWGVNLFAVIALAILGAGFVSGRRPVVRYAVWFGAAFCLADWLLVEDLGFLGGLGTDPNSMVPVILLFTAGYVALSPQPQEAVEAAAEPTEAAAEPTEAAAEPGQAAAEPGQAAAEPGQAAEPGADRAGWWRRLRLADLSGALASVSVQSVTAVAAVAVSVIGAAPMAAAAANRTADPILAEAIAGNTTALDVPAPDFQLTDQNGRGVSLTSLRGKVVLVTFLDPVCTTDCPIIGAEFRQAAVQLGAAGKNVELVAVVANPVYRSIAVMRAFDAEEGLTSVPNWLYLTGSLGALQKVWQQFGVTVQNVPAGVMSLHSDIAVVIDRNGTIRTELDDDPGPGTASTKSSFSTLLANYARQALADQ